MSSPDRMNRRYRLRDASSIFKNASAHGQRLSQRSLARQLRRHGHHFPNDHLHQIAETIGLGAGRAAGPAMNIHAVREIEEGLPPSAPGGD